MFSLDRSDTDPAEHAYRMARADHAWLLFWRVSGRLDRGNYRQQPAARRFWVAIADRLWRAGLLQDEVQDASH